MKGKALFEQYKYLQRNQLIVFILLLAILILVNFFNTNQFFPTMNTKSVWFYSGIFMIFFSLLFIEPYFTSPKNVIINAMPLVVLFVAIREEVLSQEFWWIAFAFFSILIVLSIISISVENNDKSPDSTWNRVSNILKRIVVAVGQGKILYSIVFFYFLLSYKSIQSPYTVQLFIFWSLVICINPRKLHNSFVSQRHHGGSDSVIGEIFGVQSKKMFLVKLYDDRKHILKFDIVRFRYSMQDSDEKSILGIVFDTYLLNREKWAKVLQIVISDIPQEHLKKNTVYKSAAASDLPEDILRKVNERFIGIVIEGSKIGKIKFEYSKKKGDIQEGDLLELSSSKRRLFYQVTSGVTEKEKLEARNETGFIEGEAIQLGEWKNEKMSFQKYGWVPSINTPIYLADCSDIKLPIFKYPNYKIGKIPGTDLPSILNLHDAIKYHLALLGITGAGKSFLAMQIIQQLMSDYKIVCIDLTGEWKERLSKWNPVELIDSDGLKIVEMNMAKKEDAAMDRNKKKADVLQYKKKIQDKVSQHVKEFAESSNEIAIFELPDLSNTSFILEFTQFFLEGFFLYAKENIGCKFCIVLEEAHTVIPETSFLGDFGDYSSNKSLVNKMGQIALQGRKYGVGFLIIAQRTAIVSKTILTQCNTVVCFQAFDETSFRFLGNYVGDDIVRTLPNLKQFHAIVAGKAVTSNIPMIVDLTRNESELHRR